MRNKSFESMTESELLNILQIFETEINHAKQQCENVAQLHSKIEEQYKNAGELSTKIKKHHEYINNLFSQIQTRDQKIEELYKNKQKEFETLTKKIEALLPGATSAGLSSSYHRARQNRKVWPFWVGFLSSLSLLMSGYFYYFVWKDASVEWGTIAIRTTVGLPLVWIAWYCQRSISQITRIKEEYHHKETLMSMYEGFSKEIGNLADNEIEANQQKVNLVSVLLDAVRKNPAEALDPSGTLLDEGLPNKTKKQE